MRDFPEAPAPPVDSDAPGPLHGLRVVEESSWWTALAGKMLAELGAEVVLVEPPQGAPMRTYEPFYEDIPGPDRSLWWWYYQTSKKGVVAADDAGLARLVANADIFVTGRPRGATLAITNGSERLITVSVTPFGSDIDPTASTPATDLTILAGGGPVWSCGYDDHSIAPVRGGGNQAMHTACLHAVPALLVAVVAREASGRGQHVDISAFAAANITTEAASYNWLVSRQTVQRLTARHASVKPTMSSMAYDRDGRPVNTGVPPRSAAEFTSLRDWLVELDALDQLEEGFFLEMAIERGGIRLSELAGNPEAQAMYGAGRAALLLIAKTLSGYEFFLGAQRRGLPVGVINAPEDVMEDPHFAARGFHVDVHHDELGRTIRYPGAPWGFEKSPWRLYHRAPSLGEHDAEVWGAL